MKELWNTLRVIVAFSLGMTLSWTPLGQKTLIEFTPLEWAVSVLLVANYFLSFPND